jgi:hypothetical protein
MGGPSVIAPPQNHISGESFKARCMPRRETKRKANVAIIEEGELSIQPLP